MSESSFLKCLCDPTRFTILRALGTGGPRNVGDLVNLTGKEQTNVSHHLAQLRECGLVLTEQQGKQVVYSLGHPRLAPFLEEAADLAEHIACVDATVCCEAGCC